MRVSAGRRVVLCQQAKECADRVTRSLRMAQRAAKGVEPERAAVCLRMAAIEINDKLKNIERILRGAQI